MTAILLGKERVIDTKISLTAHPSAVGAARRFVRESLRAWRAAQFIDSVELVTSELVTNALLHAHSAPVLRLSMEDSCVRLEVSDASRIGPVRKSYGPSAGTGRGIVLVQELTASWGVDVNDSGKTVWCEFDADSVRDTGSERATG